MQTLHFKVKTHSWVRLHLSGERNKELQGPGCTTGNKFITKWWKTPFHGILLREKVHMGSREPWQLKSIKIHWTNRDQLCFRKSLSRKWWKPWREPVCPVSSPSYLLSAASLFFYGSSFSDNKHISVPFTNKFLSIRNSTTLWLFDFTSCALIYACKIHEEV